MKNILKLMVALFLISGTAIAQSKVGHVDFDSIIRLMPRYDSVKKQSEEYGKNLDIEYKTMYMEYEKKVADYKANEAIWTDMIKNLRKKDIAQLEQTLQEFPQNAQNEMAKKNQELLAPLEKAARKAVEDVAKEYKFTMVLDNSLGTLLYSLPSDDLMPLVKKKLGILK